LKKPRKTRSEPLTNKLFLVVERDIRLFFQYRFMIIMRAIWFVSQIALFGLIASRMVTIPNYFNYYVAGLSVMTLYSAAIFIGFDLYEEAEHGVFEYLLSLPVSRRQLVLGRSIGGGLRAFIYVGPLIAVSLYVIGSLNPIAFLISLFALFMFAFGMSGMSIALAVIIKSSDRFDILMGVLDALIVRLSTAMYPLAVLQASSPFYAGLASLNPLTYVTDLFRWGTAVTPLTNPLLPVLVVVAFFGFFTFVGVTIYDRQIEGGGWQ
jgi:ABC-2 type transport system permease protein